MPDPSSTVVALSAVAGVGLASILPGVDGNAVVGVFAGRCVRAALSRNASGVLNALDAIAIKAA